MGMAAALMTSKDYPIPKKAWTNQLLIQLLHSSKYIFQIIIVLLWYITNAMNGIVMQSYSYHFDHSITHVLLIWSNASFITCVQLLTGVGMGRLLLYCINRNITWQNITATHSLPLSLVHGFGNLSTNLGYMYGKASIIQVLKLLEPFETLILSFFLFSEVTCSTGVVCSMSIVVGASMSLLQQQSEPIATAAIVYAIISGFTLSSRNVLQRKHGQSDNTMKDFTKLERALIQFTQMSYYSGMEVAMFTLIQYLTLSILPILSDGSTQHADILSTQHVTLELAVYHPLYNVFSMITLGFVSALTHSLWNAAKRVFAVLLAMVWFREGMNATTVLRLTVIGVGAVWYSRESKLAGINKVVHDGSQRTTQAWDTVAAPLLTVIALAAVFLPSN